MSKLLTSQDVAARLNVAHVTALKYFRDGVITGGKKIGRYWFILESKFEEWLSVEIAEVKTPKRRAA